MTLRSVVHIHRIPGAKRDMCPRCDDASRVNGTEARPRLHERRQRALTRSAESYRGSTMQQQC